MTHIFLSYQSQISSFVAKISHCLQRQTEAEVYYHPDNRRAGSFPEHIKRAIERSTHFIWFGTLTTATSEWQYFEIDHWFATKKSKSNEKIVIVTLGDFRWPAHLAKDIHQRYGMDIHLLEREELKSASQENAILCACRIIQLLRLRAAAFDDLPLRLDARYEKEIIGEYASRGGVVDDEHVEIGYPRRWPPVARQEEPAAGNAWILNPLDPKIYGKHRPDAAAILVDARLRSALAGAVAPADAASPIALAESGAPSERAADGVDAYVEERTDGPLTFPEAGPRPRILRPRNTLRVAILVSGGIAPGINAVIAAIVERHRIYEKASRSSNPKHSVVLLGCWEGLKALCGTGGRILQLDKDDEDQLRRWIGRGGSWLSTAREDVLLTSDPAERADLLNDMAFRLHNSQVDILYVIGGEGSMRAAHAIVTVFRSRYPDRNLSVVGIPKTMDNDILWVWQSFGFLSAVEEAKQVITQLVTEVRSNPRLGIVQLFGSTSGFVAAHAALGSTNCDLVLIPEMDFSMLEVCAYLDGKLSDRLGGETDKHSPFALVVMAETAIPFDFELYWDEPYVGLSGEERAVLAEYAEREREIIGQTPDQLRSAAMKIVSGVIKQYVREVMGNGDLKLLSTKLCVIRAAQPEKYWSRFRVIANEPRHLIRSVEPSASDVVFGSRLGTIAVDTAQAGFTDCMISQWLTEYVIVPLKLVVLGRKRVPRDGVFWRTVVAHTGQMEVDGLT